MRNFTLRSLLFSGLFALLLFGSNGSATAQSICTLGTGTITNGTSSYPSPYGQYYTAQKVEYLILASELTAQGFGPGALSSLAFDVVTPAPLTTGGVAPDGSSLRNFSIWIDTTTASSLTAWLPATQQVYTVPQFITTVGWNTHKFSTPFVWDGISNIVIKTCFNNWVTGSNYSQNAIVRQSTTPVQLVRDVHFDINGVCDTNVVSSITNLQRPNIRLGFAVSNDAGISAIVSPTAPALPGLAPVQVTLTNYGLSTLASATIGWSVNGLAQTPYSFSGGTLTTNQSSSPLTLGSFVFPQGYSTIRAWASNPNGQADTINYNDTSSVTLYFASPMSGPYTIGGTSANYPTIQDALTDMVLRGLSGPVTFNVTPNSGPYTAGIEFTTIPGLSEVNTVTFNGNANVFNESTPSYFFAFNGSSYITLNNFRLINTNSGNPKWGIHVRGASHHLTFTNNYIDLGITSTNSLMGGIIVSNALTGATVAGNNGKYLTITGNEIIGGYYSITLIGAASYQNNYGHLVSNNIIRDWYLYGIYMINGDTNTITNNDVNRATRTSLSTFYGIYLTTCRNIKITKNRIHSTGVTNQTTYPIYVSTTVNSAGFETEIANNAIYNIQTTGGVYGIYFAGTGNNYVNVFHNTLNLYLASNTGTVYGIYSSLAPNNHVYKNNIVSIRGAGTGTKFGIYCSATSTSFVSDYNLIHLAGTGTNYTGYWSAANRATLADWQTASMQDMSSFDVNPEFFTNSDFRTNSLSLWQAGTPITSVTDDIFGTPRNAMAPCIGAYEYLLYARDATIPMMTSPFAVCPGTTPVKVKIRNNGIQSFTGATITWSVNGIAQTPFAYTNTLAVSTEEEVTLGNFNFLAGVSYNFVFYSSNPGGQADQNPGNDTLRFNNFKTAMSGIYTVGTAPTADFTTIAAAVANLNAYGICGPVTINVAANTGPYVGGFSLKAVDGSSVVNTITFNGNGNVINQGTAPVFVGFEGSKYVTFDNFKLIHSDPVNANQIGIWISGGARYLTITNNLVDQGTISTLAGGSGISVSGTNLLPTQAGNNGQYITISNNTVSGGYYGITLCGNTSYLDCYGNTVSNNIIKDFYIYGIYLLNVDTSTVIGNNISRPARQSISTFYGVYSANIRNTKIIKNQIHTGGVGAYTAYPIYTSVSANSPGFETEYINNVIYNIPTTSTCYGMYLLGTGNNYVNIYHNTFQLTAPAGTGASRGIFMSTAPNNYNVKNNIISFSGPGTGTKYGMYVTTTSTTFVSDYNVINFNTGGTVNYTGYWTANRLTLADWQTASLQDMSSTNANPVFGNPAVGNITPLNLAIDNIGTPLGITTDLYNNPRSTVTPDPGAVEFTGISADMALLSGKLANQLCLNNNDTVMLTIKNTVGTQVDFSTNPLTASWSSAGPVNSTGTITVNTGTLNPDSILTVTGTGVNMSVPGNYVLSANISPNTKNLFTGNDSLFNTFTLEIRNPLYVIPQSANIINPADTVKLEVRSTFFPAGNFYFSEICHFKYTVGAPLGGVWPSYMLSDDYMEITGVPNSDLGGFKLEQWTTTAIASTHTFAPGTFLSPNGTAIIAVGALGASVPSPANYYYHGNGTYTSDWGSSTTAGRILYDAAGNIVDAAGYGNYTFPAAANVPSFAWSSPNTLSPGSTSGSHLIAPDNNTGSCWAVTSSSVLQDPNVPNANTVVPSAQGLTGFAWSHNGMVIDTVNTEITVGPFTTAGVHSYIASYQTPCGLLKDTVNITVQYITVSPDTAVCLGDSIQVSAYLPGVAPWTLIVSDGTGTDTVSGITNATWTTWVMPSVTTTYSVVKFKDATSPWITANKSVVVTVHPLPVVTLAPLMPVCIDAAPVTLSGGMPAGGTYSGTGVATGVFNPATAGVGTHLITYTYKDVYGCMNMDMDTMKVNALPVVNLPVLTPVCLNAAPLTLTSGTPAGGTYSGTGVSGGIFSPATAGVGTFVITYAYKDVNNCTNTDTSSILVRALPVVTAPTLSAVCINAAPVTLSGGTPAGGTYSGTAVIGGVFTPSIAGAGSFVITYAYTDGNSCTNSDTTTILVNALPTVTLTNLAPVCVYTPAFTLTGGSPAGGTYAGPGVSGGMFDPAVAGAGMHAITYTYTNAATNCTNSTMDSIFVDLCIGIEDAASALTFNLFPNPASDVVNIELSGISSSLELRMLNLAGQVVYTERIEKQSSSIKRSINVSQFPAGVYYIRLTGNNLNKVEKVVIE